MMRYFVLVVMFGVGIGLSGCGKSAQDQLAEEQLKAIQAQKEMLAGAEATRPASAPQLDTSTKTYKPLNLYKSK